MRQSHDEHQKIKSQTTRRVKTFFAWKGPPTVEVFSWKDFSSAKYMNSTTSVTPRVFYLGSFLRVLPSVKTWQVWVRVQGRTLPSHRAGDPKLAWPLEAISEGFAASAQHGLISFPETYQSCPRGQAIKALLQCLGVHNSMVFHPGTLAQPRWEPPRVRCYMAWPWTHGSTNPSIRGDISHLASLGVGSAEQSLILAEPRGLMCCTHKTNLLPVYTQARLLRRDELPKLNWIFEATLIPALVL